MAGGVQDRTLQILAAAGALKTAHDLARTSRLEQDITTHKILTNVRGAREKTEYYNANALLERAIKKQAQNPAYIKQRQVVTKERKREIKKQLQMSYKKRKGYAGRPRGPPRSRVGYGNYGGDVMTVQKERKWKDTFMTNIQVVRDANFVFPLNLIETGTGPDQRIGKKIRIHSLQINVQASPTILPANGAIQFRATAFKWCIVWDKQPNGTQATWKDVFDPSGVDNNTWDLLNLNNRDRFKIIRTKTIGLNAITSVQVTPAVSGLTVLPQHTEYCWEEYMRWRPPMENECFFSGLGASIANIQTGALLLMMTCDFNAATGSADTRFNARVRYTD